jgi:hypothetical protein
VISARLARACGLAVPDLVTVDVDRAREIPMAL